MGILTTFLFLLTNNSEISRVYNAKELKSQNLRKTLFYLLQCEISCVNHFLPFWEKATTVMLALRVTLVVYCPLGPFYMGGATLHKCITHLRNN